MQSTPRACCTCDFALCLDAGTCVCSHASGEVPSLHIVKWSPPTLRMCALNVCAAARPYPWQGDLRGNGCLRRSPSTRSPALRGRAPPRRTCRRHARPQGRPCRRRRKSEPAAERAPSAPHPDAWRKPWSCAWGCVWIAIGSAIGEPLQTFAKRSRSLRSSAWQGRAARTRVLQVSSDKASSCRGGAASGVEADEPGAPRAGDSSSCNAGLRSTMRTHQASNPRAQRSGKDQPNTGESTRNCKISNCTTSTA